MSRLRFVFGMLCVYGLTVHAAFPNASSLHALPFNIIVDRTFEAIVAHMLQRSPTFRAQCTDLGGVAVLRVRLVLRSQGPPFSRSHSRAEAMIRKYEYGRIDALVRLPSADNAAELIAHELEHVREVVEGTNYHRLSFISGTGIWMTASGHFETARATTVGERVAAEVGRP
jgi:hypothetical protein